jgi:hypothetical protein
MRFFFHAHRGEATYPDPEGSCLPSRQAAAAHAETIARELAVGGRWRGAWLLVVDESGTEVARVQVPPLH